MESEISLQDLYQHPLVAEMINENKQLRATLSEKPEVKDLNDVPLPYTIKRHVLINEGVHNGLFYSAQMLRMALNQHEGLSLFLDHHSNDQGGTALTWCGSILNPSWSEADKGIIGDIDIVDPKTAIALAYGAKFGISATVDVDTIKKDDGSEIANDPLFKSYSIVLDPAVRETMLNEKKKNKGGENIMEESRMELDLKEDLKPALETLEDAIKRASAKRDNDILVPLRQTKAILISLSGSSYPYPGKEKMSDDFSSRLEALDQTIKNLSSLLPEMKEEDPKSEELEALKEANKTMGEQLATIEHEKLATSADAILNKELELGLILAAGSEARKMELEAMNGSSLEAIEGNLDKTLKILETTPSADDSKPELKKEGTRKELGKDTVKAHDQKILEMMMSEQKHHNMPLGGF